MSEAFLKNLNAFISTAEFQAKYRERLDAFKGTVMTVRTIPM